VIDITGKALTLRTAVARAVLRVSPATIDLIRQGKIPKGDPIAAARIAAVQAAKETGRLIPYCHPVPVGFVGVEFEVGSDTIAADVTVKAVYRTGVEMEALTAASVAALTLYDMLKMLDKEMAITGVRLLSKKGGRSDHSGAFDTPPCAAVVVASDSVAAGAAEDRSGALIAERLEKEGFVVAGIRAVADDREVVAQTIRELADESGCDLVLTTGGTGLGPRDTTPEATGDVIEHDAPGIAEAARAFGQDRTPRAMLSRGRAGVRGRCLIVNLPGSERAAAESLDALFPGIRHAFAMLRGEGHPGGESDGQESEADGQESEADGQESEADGQESESDGQESEKAGS